MIRLRKEKTYRREPRVPIAELLTIRRNRLAKTIRRDRIAKWKMIPWTDPTKAVTASAPARATKKTRAAMPVITLSVSRRPRDVMLGMAYLLAL